MAIRGGASALGILLAFGFATADLKAQAQNESYWSGAPVVSTPPAAGHVRPHAWIRQAYIGPASAAPAVRTGPGGFWPLDMQTAYGMAAITTLPSLGNKLTGGGAGITVGIVDAYHAPNAKSDLNQFSIQFGLPAFPAATGSVCSPTFTQVGETGGASPTTTNSSWEVETSLDVQWVHAIAPCANILLVEASSTSSTDLLAAAKYAAAHAQVVNMSWGTAEFSGESSDDTSFQTASVVFVASSGDTGGVVEWPSISKNVLAVGGTDLPVNSSTGGLGTGAETAWTSSGGGCSAQSEAEPSVETVIKYPKTCATRGVPDVAASAGPGSAVSVYISDQKGWNSVYGTSLAAPIWSATLAISDALRKAAGKAYLTNATLADVYSAYSKSYSTMFNDITSGTAGSNTAGTGWDFVTGLGSPKGSVLIPYFGSTAP